MRVIPVAGLVILTALLYGCGGGPGIEKVTEASTVVAFGDSLTSGYGARENESYPSVLAELLGCNVVNSGVQGEDTSAGLRRLPAVLEKNKPDLVILCYGGNDMLRKQFKARTRANLKSMISLIQDANTDVVLVGVPDPGMLLTIPDLYGKLARKHDVPLDSDSLEMVLSTPSLKSDLIHPNTEGYRIIAQSLFSLIRKSENF